MNNAKRDATKSSNSRIASLATYLQRYDENMGKPKITSLEQDCLMYNVVYECIVYHCIHVIRYSFIYVHDVIDYMPRGSMMYHSGFSTQTKYHCEPNILHGVFHHSDVVSCISNKYLFPIHTSWKVYRDMKKLFYGY